MTWLTLALVALATYRLTRLVTADRITDRLRDWCQGRGDFLAYLSTCDWCLSVWIAPWPAVAVVVWPDSRIVLAVLLALSASALTGLLAAIEGRISGEYL